MAAFDYRPIARTVFGPGEFSRLGDLAAGLGGKRALIVSDPGIVQAGFTNQALRHLMPADVQAFLFDGVEENPTDRTVAAGAAFAAEKEVDLIIGLGGGSSVDCAKGINFVLTNGGRMQDYRGYGKAAKPLLPLIAVPTTAGTGSEAQSYALVSDAETHQKMACGDPKAAPAITLLDPELTVSMPRVVTAQSGIDAFTHAVETWVTKKRNAVSALYSQEAFRLLDGNLEAVLRDPENMEARAAMQLGAYWAGAAIEASMLGAAHSCANPLTARYGVVHGEAVGMMLPAVIRFNARAVGDLYDQWGGAEALAARVESLLAVADLPVKLRERGVEDAALPELAEQAAAQWTARFNPRPVGASEFLEIYRCVY